MAAAARLLLGGGVEARANDAEWGNNVRNTMKMRWKKKAPSVVPKGNLGPNCIGNCSHHWIPINTCKLEEASETIALSLTKCTFFDAPFLSKGATRVLFNAGRGAVAAGT